MSLTTAYRQLGRVRTATSGAAYVEFLLAFMVILLFFMGLVQLSLLFGARLIVQHAANRAVRAAVVVLDDDPAYYNNEPRNWAAGAPLTADVLQQTYSRVLGNEATTAYPLLSRRATIELAAAVPLAPLAPLGVDSVLAGIGGGTIDQAADYTIGAMRVAFPYIPGSTISQSFYTQTENVTVRLEYSFPCTVPMVRFLICREANGTQLLVSEATLPNQGAAYPYMSTLPAP